MNNKSALDDDGGHKTRPLALKSSGTCTREYLPCRLYLHVPTGICAVAYKQAERCSDDPLSERVIRRLLLKLPSARFGILFGSSRCWLLV